MANIASTIASAAKRLEAGGVAQPRRESASLIAFSIGRDAAFIIAHPEYELTLVEAAKFEDAVVRRAGREPFQLIVGKQEFYGLDFEVEAGVLIPRPETELLVEKAIQILGEMEQPTFLEVGVGTGCIAISILDHVIAAKGTGVDISDRALALARRNAERHGVSDRMTLQRSDLFEGVENGKFGMIVSNPPYIPDGDSRQLQPEVIDYDPPEALFAGEDGLDLIRRIVAESPRYLDAAGYLLIEIGHGQAGSVKEMFAGGLWTSVDILDDLQGIPRTVVARRA